MIWDMVVTLMATVMVSLAIAVAELKSLIMNRKAVLRSL